MTRMERLERAPDKLRGALHELSLIEADTQRGITDCSTPIFQRLRNIVEMLNDIFEMLNDIFEMLNGVERDRDAFVKLFDPERGSVVYAMTQAQSLAARCAEAEAERDHWHSRAAKYLAVLKCANNNTRRAKAERDDLRAKYADALTVLRWARISDHPIAGLGVNQGLSMDAEARAALGRIRPDMEGSKP